MVTLDKARKLPFKTYFFYPADMEYKLIQLMENSSETDYTTHEYSEMKTRVPKSKQIQELVYYADMPELIDKNPKFCISNYPANYLFDKIEDLTASPEEIEKAKTLAAIILKNRQE